MKRLFFLMAFLFVCSIGCKKDFPVASIETPVFYFNGTVNGTYVDLKAGVNDYYMYSSFFQDNSDVYNFFAELRQNNCTNCINKIKFQINDDTVSPPTGNSQANTSLTVNYYSIQLDSAQTGTSTEYDVFFISDSDSLNTTVNSWDFGDGTSESGTFSTTHTYTHPGYYDVCLTVSDNNGTCTSSICNQIKVDVPDASCEVSIIDSMLSGNTVLFSAVGNGTLSTYLWDFGDGTTSNLNQVSHIFPNAGSYKVCLQTTDLGGCSSNSCKNISTQGFAGCLANFNSSVLSTQYLNPFSLSNVVITWTDNSGIVYSSNSISQPDDSYFQIISVENYLNNENNEPTKKLHVKFKCTLSDGNTSIQIDNGDAVIAVSYR